MLSTLAVLRSSSCFEQAIIQIPLALAIMDNDRRILYANAQASTLFGCPESEMLGQHIDLLVPQGQMDWGAPVDGTLAREVFGLRRDGARIPIEVTVSGLTSPSGGLVLALFQDFSARRRADAVEQQALRRRNAELQRLNVELDEFVSTASHDLRSPLTNVGSLAQWILDDDESLSAQTRDRLLLIQGRIERMKRLLNDIREYALSGSTQEIAGPSLSASALLVDIIASVGVPPGFSVLVEAAMADVPVKRIPLIQVFHNLIGNAIKHHDRKSGTIALSVDSNGSMLRFVVRDDGPGVPAQYREAIFSMFKMLKPRDQVEGSGMGLALVRKIVSRMGGACGVESGIARGAAFWFEWPKLPGAAVPPASRNPSMTS
jgi:PAS domain S-box-containing protein